MLIFLLLFSDTDTDVEEQKNIYILHILKFSFLISTLTSSG